MQVSVDPKMAALEENSRVFLTSVKRFVTKLINACSAILAITELGASLTHNLVFNLAKLKMMEFLIEIQGMEDPRPDVPANNGRGDDDDGHSDDSDKPDGHEDCTDKLEMPASNVDDCSDTPGVPRGLDSRVFNGEPVVVPVSREVTLESWRRQVIAMRDLELSLRTAEL